MKMNDMMVEAAELSKLLMQDPLLPALPPLRTEQLIPDEFLGANLPGLDFARVNYDCSCNMTSASLLKEPTLHCTASPCFAWSPSLKTSSGRPAATRRHVSGTRPREHVDVIASRCLLSLQLHRRLLSDTRLPPPWFRSARKIQWHLLQAPHRPADAHQTETRTSQGRRRPGGRDHMAHARDAVQTPH